MNALVPLFRRLSPAGNRARLSILIFHRVVQSPDPLFPEVPDAGQFVKILGWINSWFNVLPLDEAVQKLVRGTLPERAAAITFDDGYADNFRVALPLLVRQALPATFFVATGFLDGGRMWNDDIVEAIRNCDGRDVDLSALGLGRYPTGTTDERRAAIDKVLAAAMHRSPAERRELVQRVEAVASRALPVDLMMTADEVRGLRRAGMQIGAHTVSHPMLTKLPPDEARSEISGSKSRLEDLLGESVHLFAYPSGRRGNDYSEEHVALVRELGFDAAVSTNWGAASEASDLMELPRFTPWDRGRLRFGARLAANLARSAQSGGRI